MYLLGITWNPDKALLEIGSFQLRYYSLMFVIAFLLGWYLTKKIFNREKQPLEKLDTLFVYMVIAILIGARLGHVFFYDWDYFSKHLLEIFLPFRFSPKFEFTGFTGLASHGAAIGVLIAMYYYKKKYPDLTLAWILDRIVIAVASGAIFVRLGNFMNSEINGKVTDESFPLGVRFIQDAISERQAIQETGAKTASEAYNLIAKDPQFADILNAVPFRHPAQLYEAFGYVFVFLILWYVYWKTEKRKQPFFLFGLFLVLLWTVRFFVEFLKESQGGFESSLGNLLSTGQWLSIPFIIAGFYFMFKPSKKTA
ncbi:prolipoprotein diacylglyceryl transferase [Leptobacterium flavescens]|uniref:Phosphatidylglycerol--prolipoprotein diacylglyceryl transferase n=1 Tax=Leptobacterium flavescens TaxID=472055 RepID=A0A6P0UX47_9FLAO|nr:prolipoprotein diacylglyceryl transferase [Leptobacterium flavescens]NER15303.1 prolipoprotein diacylglyceryl transferase [Leptobacterium flavescens]